MPCTSPLAGNRSLLSASLAILAGAAVHAGCSLGNGNHDPSVQSVAGASLSCTEPRTNDARDVACSRWACAHATLAGASWDGDAKRCVAGSIDARANARALALINAYRFLAGVHELAEEPTWDAPAQDCALMAQANRKLSHEPPPGSACWSDRGVRASAVSLIANRSAPLAVDAYIEDPANEPTMVHRRWLLGDQLQRIGLGSTSGFSCALVDGSAWDPPASTANESAVDDTVETRAARAPVAWVAWPPPGAVPIDAFARTAVDRLGWTVQSSTLDLDGAHVEVRRAGALLPIKVSALERMSGSFTAVRFVPDGWSSEAGRRYDVHVQTEGVLVDYAVTPVACD